MKAAFNFSIVLVCINYKHRESPVLLISHPAVRGVLVCGMCIGRTAAVSVQWSWTPPLKFYYYSMCGMHPHHATRAFSLAGFPYIYIWDTFHSVQESFFPFFCGGNIQVSCTKACCSWVWLNTHLFVPISSIYIGNEWEGCWSMKGESEKPSGMRSGPRMICWKKD